MRFFKLIGAIFIILGVCLFAYPIVTSNYVKHETTKFVKEFNQDESIGQTDKEFTSKDCDSVYQEIVNYNTRIYEEHQKDFKNVSSYEQIPPDLSDKVKKKFGYITIPKMDVELPLFIGASDENLSKGAAILGQTSIPIGGINTNSVISGHRGYMGIPFFRDIEKLEIGDKVKITNPWEVLTYKVTGIDVIEPDDRDAITIEEGKDMITLITCHPYRSHGKQRYVVYCTRKGTKNSEKGLDQDYEIKAIKTSTFDIQRENSVRTVGLLIILFSLATVIILKIVRRVRCEKVD